MDLRLIIYTMVAIISKQRAIDWVVVQLNKMNADRVVINISKRETSLYPHPPPGSNNIVTSR